MKKIIISAACLAMALASCNQIETSENDCQATPLNINVKTAVETKGTINNRLPIGSSVGVFLADESGVTYDGQTVANVMYTDTGTESSQNWSAESDVMLSNTRGTVSAYYPYNEDVTDIKTIPVQVTSDVQTDFMWATPVGSRYNKLPGVGLTMNHALTAVRLHIYQAENEMAAEITSVAFSSEGAATEALLDATNGTLSSFNGTGTQFVANETFTTSTTAKSFTFITVPTGVAAPINIEMIVNGKKVTAVGDKVTLKAGFIHEYILYVADGLDAVAMGAMKAKDWNVVYADNDGTHFYEDVEFNFDGTIPEPFEQWAAIQHKDGSLYSPEKWEAFADAGALTVSDANGVVVLYSKSAVCPHVIHPDYEQLKWSSSNVAIPGVTLASSAEGVLDVNGKANTEAILAAVADGTIADAPAAQYCAGITFANGQQGYLPAAGEVQAWIDNAGEINKCFSALGLHTSYCGFWTSTQSSANYALNWYHTRTYNSIMSESKTSDNYTGYPFYARPVTSFVIE